MNRILSFLKLIVLSLALTLASAGQSLFSQDYNILPLGNSITASVSFQPGYRYYLWDELTTSGVDFDFVGSQSGNDGGNYSGWPAGFDPDHEGHPGWESHEVLGGLTEWMQGYVPDIVLIHVGTNDMLQNQSVDKRDRTIRQLNGTIRVLRMANPKVSIFIAQIIPSTTAYIDAAIVSLNSQIDLFDEVTHELYDPQSPIVVVDCYSAMDKGTDFRDYVHPNALGEEKMGSAFHDAIMANLPPVKHRWLGGSGTSWSTAANWNKNSVPTSDNDVVILKNATTWPTFTGNFTVGSNCRNFMMEDNTQFTVSGDFIYRKGETVSINGDAQLNISGDWKDSESFYGGGKVSKSGNTYMDLDAYNEMVCTIPFQLISVKVYPENLTNPGSRTFYWSAYNSGSGLWEVQEEATVAIPADPGGDGSRVDLNFNITVSQAGFPHRIGIKNSVSNQAKLARDFGASLYPISIGVVGELVGAGGVTPLPDWRYWYLYDYEYLIDDPTALKSTLNFGSSNVNFSGIENNTIVGNSIISGGGKVDFSTSQSWGGSWDANTLDVLHSFRLLSVKVNAQGAGTKSFYWRSANNSIGDTVTVDLVAGVQRVDLNFVIPPGNNHKLGILGGGPNLRFDKESDDLAHPFTIGNVAHITAIGNILEYYFYLFDIEFEPCFYDVNVNKPGYVLTTDGSFSVANDLSITEGSYLTLDTDDTLSVGVDFNLLADASGMASFVNNGNLNIRGFSRVGQYISPNRWHYVSSPISDAKSGIFTGVYLKYFNEPSYLWNYITSTTAALSPMVGYSAWNYTSAYVANYVGELNIGPQSANITAQHTPTNIGYNLVGNPYASSLDWDVALGWDKSNIDNTIYFWKGNNDAGGSGNYYYYVGSGGTTPGSGIGTTSSIIPPGQGFFVKANNNGTIGVNSNAQVHNAQPFYKQAAEFEQIRLQATNAVGLEDETIIRFNSGATVEHDGQYDAYKLFGYLYPQLYSRTPENSELAVNTLPAYEDGTVVPLGFIAPEDGQYSINLNEFVNFSASTTLYLEDLLTGDLHELSDNPSYAFVASVEDDPNRFNLLFKGVQNVVDAPLVSAVRIYSFEKDVIILLPETAQGTIVRIFDLVGKEIQTENINGQTKASIPVNGQKGYYVVKVQTGEEVYTEKVFIQ